MKSVSLKDVMYCLMCPCGTLLNSVIPHTCPELVRSHGYLKMALWNSRSEAPLTKFYQNPYVPMFSDRPFGITYSADIATDIVPVGCVPMETRDV